MNDITGSTESGLGCRECGLGCWEYGLDSLELEEGSWMPVDGCRVLSAPMLQPAINTKNLMTI